MMVYLYVDKPVAALQCDVATAGTASTMLSPSANKFFSTAPQPDGYLRIVIFGLGLETFSGLFASVTAPVAAIKEVVGSDPAGLNANVSVGKLSSPSGLHITV